MQQCILRAPSQAAAETVFDFQRNRNWCNDPKEKGLNRQIDLFHGLILVVLIWNENVFEICDTIGVFLDSAINDCVCSFTEF